MSKVAVVTGSNKGIGFAIVKGLCQRINGVVYLTSRDEARGLEAVDKLKKIGLNPEYHQLDISDRSSVKRFRDYIEEKHGGLDILINNAAVADSNFTSVTYEDAKRVIDINYKSILTVKELIYPLIRNDGRVLNISSICGHLANIKNEYWIQRLSKKDLSEADINEFVNWYLESIKDGTFNYKDIADGGTVASYRVSKVALSAITMIHQRELEPRNISVNSMHPGVVKTDMTLGNGFYNIDQAAATPIYLALDAPQTLKGSYVWYDKAVIDWFDYNGNYNFRIEELFE